MKQSICIIADHLGISSQALFHEYHVSLLWHCNQGGRFADIPYQTFGFDNMRIFAQEYAEELFCQLVALGHLDQTINLCKLLHISEITLLEHTAARINLYATILCLAGQKFDSRRFMMDSLGTNRYQAAVSTHVRFCEALKHLCDSSDAEVVLRNAGRVEEATRASTLLLLFPKPSQCSACGPLQTTTSMVLSILFEETDCLNIPTTVMCLRMLFIDVSSVCMVEQVRVIRNLCFLCAVSGTKMLEGYALASVLRGLSSILISKSCHIKGTICSLILRILSNITNLSSDFPWERFQALVLVIDTARKTALTQELKRALRNLSSDYKKELGQSQCDLSMLMSTETGAQNRSVDTVLQIVSMARNFFSTSDAAYKVQTKQILLELLSSVVTIEMLQNAGLVEDLVAIIKYDYVPASAEEIVFFNRVKAMSVVLQISNKTEELMTSNVAPISRQIVVRALIRALMCTNAEKVGFVECALQNLCCLTDISIIDGEIPNYILEAFQATSKFNTTPIQWVQDKAELVIVHTEYHQWLTNLSSFLLEYVADEPFYAHIKDAVRADMNLALEVIGALVRFSLSRSIRQGDEMQTIIAAHFQRIFADHVNLGRDHILAALRILRCLREAKHEILSSNTGQFVWTSINYQSVAEAACYYGFYDEAKLFLELHVLRQSSAERDLSQLQSLQKAIYKYHAEPDSFYGIQDDPSLESAFELAKFEDNGWKILNFISASQKASCIYGNLASNPFTSPINSAFRDLSLDGLGLLQELPLSNMADSMYESAWRLENWNLPFVPTAKGSRQALYQMLCSLVKMPLTRVEDVRSMLVAGHQQFPREMSLAQPSISISLVIMLELEEVVHARSDDSDNSKLYLMLNKWHERSSLLRELME